MATKRKGTAKQKPASKPKPSKAKAAAPSPKIAKLAERAKAEMISQADFLTLMRAVKNRQREMDEARGSMGNAVKQAADRKQLDKVAFSITRRLDRLSDGKLAVAYRHLMHYVVISGIEDRATRQLDAMDKIQPVPAGDPKPKRARAKKGPPVDPKTVEPEAPPSLAGQMDLSQRTDIAADAATLN